MIVEFAKIKLFPGKWFQLIVHLRCNNITLDNRLKARGYNEDKANDIVENEVFNILGEDLAKNFDSDYCLELRNDQKEETHSNIGATLMKLKTIMQEL